MSARPKVTFQPAGEFFRARIVGKKEFVLVRTTDDGTVIAKLKGLPKVTVRPRDDR